MLKKIVKIVSINLILVFIFFILNSDFAFAAIRDTGTGYVSGQIAEFLSWIALGLTNFVGWLLSFLFSAVFWLFEHQSISEVGGVAEGWRHVRDLCNMFFVLGLLIIAFATILRYENYALKKALPKLIIMAVLINFSKMICLLLIDFSNVVMMEFAGVFVGHSGSIVDMLGLQHLMKISSTNIDLESWKLFSAIMLALAISVLTLIVMIMFIVMLAGRIIMFFILTVLSPLGFFASGIPGGNKYFGQWWGEFSKYLIVGPVLAFFTWLALTIGQGTSKLFENLETAVTHENMTDVTAAITAIGSWSNLMTYVISIGLLIGALKVTQQLGGIGSSVGMNMAMNVKNRGTRLVKGTASRVSGYDYASGVAKNYLTARRASRNDRIALTSQKMAMGIGRAKETLIQRPLVGIKNGAKTVAGLNRWRDRAKKHDANVKKHENNLDNIKTKIATKKNVEFNKQTYQKVEDEHGLRWARRSDGKKFSKDDMDDMAKQHYDSMINKEKVEAKKQREKQANMDKALKWGGLAVGGAAIGAATGGVGLLGAATAVTGGVALNKLGKTIKEAGKTDLEIGKNYNSRQIEDKRKERAEESNEEVLATFDDSTKSAFDRTASVLEALSRKIVDTNKASEMQQYVSKQFGSDKQVISRLEAALEKFSPGASRLFREADPASLRGLTGEKRAAALEKQRTATRQIRDNYQDGTYGLKNLDAGSIAKSIESMIGGLKTGKFVSQFKDLDGAKQAEIKRALKKVDSYEAREKLARITNIKTAFAERPDEAKRFTKNLTYEQVKEIFDKGDDEKVKAFKGAVTSMEHLSEAVAHRLQNESDRGAQAYRRELGL